MPATYTHHLFTDEVYRSLDIKLRNKIDYNLFCLFGKSFDILNYIYKGGSLAHYAHNNKVNLYFKNIVKSIKEKKLEDDTQCLSYLYGSICHYILDSTMHPYIFYKTGVYNKKDKVTRKYKGLHAKIENMIDAILYNDRTNNKIYNYKGYKDWAPKIVWEQNLLDLINIVYFDTFSWDCMGSKIKKALRNSSCVYRFMYDKFGVKTFIYKIIDKTGIINMPLANYTYYIKLIDDSVLNLEHKIWFYPLDKNIAYNYSVYELYDLAIVKAKKIIEEFDKCLSNGDVSQVLEDLGDLKYTTGLATTKKGKMKYFEF